MNNRVKSIDALRVIAILAVVLIHTTTRVLEVTHYDLYKYAFALFLNQFARFAVPLFFLISGFVLELSVKGELNYWEYIKKRFSKIVIPYVFWSLIYYYFVYNQNRDNLIKVLLTGDASYQLYFIPTLCIFYLIFPLLHKFYKYLGSIPVLTSLGLIQVLLMRQDYFVKQFSYPDPVRVALLAYFVFILGIAVARNKDSILKFIGSIKYFLLFICVFLTYFVFQEGRSRYYQTYNIEAFYSQWRVSVLVYTLSIGSFLFMVFEGVKDKFFGFIETLSGLSYLVFFIHVIVLEIVWNLIKQFGIGKIYFDPTFFILVSITSFVVAYLIHKIPYFAKITG